MVISSPAEYNTIITMLGCLCATVQASTGIYAAVIKKKTSLIKTNDYLFRTHRAFGGFATTLYLLGLFAGITGFISAITNPTGPVPYEPDMLSFAFHTWPSFPLAIIFILKTFISYFQKKKIYKIGKWLGIATFFAWAYTWITAAISYYVRTVPPYPEELQHAPPEYLLPYNLMWLQLLIPFVIGGLIAIPIIKKAENQIKKKKKKRKTLE